jgi:Flp pilus assembly protein TadG
MKKIRSVAKDESGAVIVIVALVLVAILSITSLATDLGLAYYQKSKLQMAVDSAALAAAYKLPDTNAATQTAKEYIRKNGFSDKEAKISFESNNTVCTVYMKYELTTFFANIFNVSKVNVSTAAKSKISEKEGNHSPVFDYCLFSGDEGYTLNMGGRFDIYGSVHSNGQFSVSPSYGYIQGSLEASHGGYFNQYTAQAGSIVYNAPVLSMPDFSSCIDQILPPDYPNVVYASQYKKYSNRLIFDGDVKVIGDLSVSNGMTVNGNLYVQGNLSISGGSPVLILNGGSLYCTGKITFGNTVSVNGGSILAMGDIQFTGATNQFLNTKSVAIYSQNGNISLTAQGADIHGIVYAPNGNVTLAGDNLRFFGSVIAHRITGIPSYLNMSEADLDLPFDFGSESAPYAYLIE